ncbi:hypothetical protein B0T22DRAFT_301925 [Podospora appendiculata]|uniref:Uncharacterized protein n=1 Tax=Podospora appendiculata TaxID=314037 RepID=A0AAE1C7R0_9PEZI|nr:hypothetical protein B0T22DRAFT_301925 [Podospora appendiculata]
MMPSIPGLQRLPLELKQEICELVSFAHGRNVLNLALASRDCYQFASRTLSRTYTLSARIPMETFYRSTADYDLAQPSVKFSCDVERRYQSLRRFGNPGHVKRLVVRNDRARPRRDEANDAVLHDRYNVPEPHSWFELDGLSAAGDLYRNAHFKPLAWLIGQLPSLQDFEFQVEGQLPPCLLDALQTYRPECRLHLDSFYLFSLQEPMLSEYEWKLATCSLLHSVRMIRYRPYALAGCKDGTGHGNELKTNIGGVLARLAPNIKRLHMTPSLSWGADTFAKVIEDDRIPVSETSIPCSGPMSLLVSSCSRGPDRLRCNLWF